MSARPSPYSRPHSLPLAARSDSQAPPLVRAASASAALPLSAPAAGGIGAHALRRSHASFSAAPAPEPSPAKVPDWMFEDEYQEEAITHMLELEAATAPQVDMIDAQPEVKWDMRPSLIDFMVEVHWSFDMASEAVLYHAINIVDRYMSKRIVLRKHYQLLACCALLLASKYDDAKASRPTIRQCMALCQGAFHFHAFVQMTNHILVTLQWSLGQPTVSDWVTFKCSALQEPAEVKWVAQYLAQISLYHRAFVGLSSASLAAAVHSLARTICGVAELTPTSLPCTTQTTQTTETACTTTTTTTSSSSSSSSSPACFPASASPLSPSTPSSSSSASLEEAGAAAGTTTTTRELFDQLIFDNYADISPLLLKKFASPKRAMASQLVRQYVSHCLFASAWTTDGSVGGSNSACLFDLGGGRRRAYGPVPASPAPSGPSVVVGDGGGVGGGGGEGGGGPPSSIPMELTSSRQSSISTVSSSCSVPPTPTVYVPTPLGWPGPGPGLGLATATATANGAAATTAPAPPHAPGPLVVQRTLSVSAPAPVGHIDATGGQTLPHHKPNNTHISFPAPAWPSGQQQQEVPWL